MSLDDSPRFGGPSGERKLSEFQYSILYMLASEPTYGLGIKRRLQSYYGQDINHGKIYPNLDCLTEWGLVRKGKIDDRTNEYALTRKGRRLAVDRINWSLAALIEDDETVEELADLIEDAALAR